MVYQVCFGGSPTLLTCLEIQLHPISNNEPDTPEATLQTPENPPKPLPLAWPGCGTDGHLQEQRSDAFISTRPPASSLKALVPQSKSRRHPHSRTRRPLPGSTEPRLCSEEGLCWPWVGPLTTKPPCLPRLLGGHGTVSLILSALPGYTQHHPDVVFSHVPTHRDLYF